MNLMKDIQQKNDCLVLQRSVLLHQYGHRLKTSGSGSFLATFIFAPFVFGAVAPFLLVRQGLMIRLLRTVLLPSLMPFLLPQAPHRN